MRRRTAPCPWCQKPGAGREAWMVPSADDSLYVIRGETRRACEDPLEPAEVRRVLDGWTDQATLYELYQAIGRGAPDLARLRRAFDRGDLLLLRIPKTRGGAAEPLLQEASEPPPSSGRGPAEQDDPRTWIEIELVDEKDKPVAGQKYRIDLPDGTMRQGALDASGRARVDNIDPGFCQVSFPDLDASEWSAA